MAAIAPNTQDHSKRRVAYYYDANIGNYYYGQGHVMKPQRIRMTHTLLLNYGLYKDLEVYRPFAASFEDMTRFHSPEYISFLRNANENEQKKMDLLKFNVGEDCPIFDGLYQFCQTSSGGSMAAAVKLNKQKTDIAINWMGGLHHAKKAEASGFCYTNDIVLGILELLKYHKRVLYVDIDVHHGDGVEEAFYTTDRVMTVSFHKYGDFFPGTGDLKDIGVNGGRLYSLNVPLRDGIRDDSYQSIFKPVMGKVMEKFQPEAIVLQCGADSLNGDRLGPFNLTLRGHGECVSFLRSYNVPMMMVGGGGYTPRNVARCWTYETALALDKEIPNELPLNDYYEYFGPDFMLHIDPSTAHNSNTREYLRKVEETVLRNLGEIQAAPSVQMQPIGDDSILSFNDLSLQQDMANPDVRLHPSIMDSVTEDQGEFFDGEMERDDGRNEHNAKEAEEKEREGKKVRISLSVAQRRAKEEKNKREKEEKEKREKEEKNKRALEELKRIAKEKEEREKEEKISRNKEHEEMKKRAREMEEKMKREMEEKEKIKKEMEEKRKRKREMEMEMNRREMAKKEMEEKMKKDLEEKKMKREMEEKKKREMEEKEEEEKEIRVKTENNSEDTPSTSDSSDPIVIEPAEMTWGAPKGEKRRMRIVNNSNERMAIKMKCSDIHAYQFEPIFSFVGVRETAKIKVVRHGIMVKEDKAVIMMVPCKDSDQDPAAVFKATPFDQQEKRTIPFKVRPPIHNDGKLGTKEEPMEI